MGTDWEEEVVEEEGMCDEGMCDEGPNNSPPFLSSPSWSPIVVLWEEEEGWEGRVGVTMGREEMVRGVEVITSPLFVYSVRDAESVSQSIGS